MPDQLQKNKYLIKLQGTLPLIVIKKMINKSYTRKKSDREKLQVIIKKKKTAYAKNLYESTFLC